MRTIEETSRSYKVCLKSDGVRYILFLSTRQGDMPVALMIDRSWNMYEVEVLAPEDYFLKGTILDGELVWQYPEETTMMYLVFDVMCCKGVRLVDTPFSERHTEVTRCTNLSNDISNLPDREVEDKISETDSVVMNHYRPRIRMRTKTFVDATYCKTLWNDRREVDHRVDGLIFNRVDSMYNVGTARDGSVIKWKPYSTVDLTCKDGRLFTSGSQLPEVVLGRKVQVDESRVVAEREGKDVLEYLVKTTDTTVHLTAIRRRTDKFTANSDFTVMATIRDSVESIGIDDLASVMCQSCMVPVSDEVVV